MGKEQVAQEPQVLTDKGTQCCRGRDTPLTYGVAGEADLLNTRQKVPS